MPSPSRCASSLPPLAPRTLLIPLQELISFPPIRLPSHIRAALMAPPTDPVSLPESHPNPSLQYQYYSDDYAGGANSGLGIVSTPKNGKNSNGRSNGNNQKMRIPMERR